MLFIESDRGHVVIEDFYEFVYLVFDVFGIDIEFCDKNCFVVVHFGW